MVKTSHTGIARYRGIYWRSIAALLVLVVLQSLNNAVFDPLLGPKPEQQPTGGRGALDLIDAMVDTAA